MKEYDLDSVLNLHPLARANEIDSGVVDEPDGSPIIFENSIVYNQSAFADPEHYAVTYPAVPVSYQNEWRDDGMCVAFAQAALDQYCCEGTDLFHIPRLAEQSPCVASLRADNSSGTSPVHREYTVTRKGFSTQS